MNDFPGSIKIVKTFQKCRAKVLNKEVLELANKVLVSFNNRISTGILQR